MSSRKRNTVMEEFIDIYKSEYCLWRIKCKEYHDKNKRAAAYAKLTEKFKELEPNATKEDVLKKINSLRSNVRKEKKKYEESIKSGASADEVYKPTLWYFHLFDFLGDQDTPRESRSNMDEDHDSPIDSADMSTENNTVIDDTENNLNSANVHTNESRVNEQDLSTKDSQTRRPRPPKKSNEDKLTNEVLTSVKEHFKRPAPQEDRYDLFGKTIAIKLRTLDKKQGLIAEKIINDTLFEAELGNLSHRSQYSTSQYTSSPSPTYRYSPIASPNSSSGTETFGPIPMQQTQIGRSLSSQDNHPGSTQNSYTVEVPQTPTQLSIPEESMTASSYYANFNFTSNNL